MQISNKARQITASMTLEIDAKAKKMKSSGLDVVGFGAGEPDFNTPDFIIEAAKCALDKGLTKYTPVSGITELKEAICYKLKRDNGLEYNLNQIIVSNGAKHSLFNIFQAILNPGDEVIIPSPYWLSYPEMVKMADGIPIFLHTDEETNFRIYKDQLEKLISSKTKAIILNSPNNPTGCIYDKEQLMQIANIAVKHGILVISDEIYEDLIYGGKKHISIASLGKDIKDLTIVVNGMSKSYAMTGWRIGYAAGNADIIKAMSNIQSHSTSNPNSIAQYASVVGLNASKDGLYEKVKEFDKRRKHTYERINNIPGLSCKMPEGAFYVMMNIVWQTSYSRFTFIQ